MMLVETFEIFIVGHASRLNQKLFSVRFVYLCKICNRESVVCERMIA